MFKKTTVMAILGTSALLICSAGIAGTVNSSYTDGTGAAPSNSLSGVYLGTDIGYGKVKQKVSGPGKTKNAGFAYDLTAGYLFNKNVGVEAGYTRFRSVRANGAITSKNNNVVDLAAKGIIPFDNGMNAFGKLGVARVSTHPVGGLQHKKVLPYLAVGTGYAVTRNVDLDVQLAGTPKSGKVPAMYAATTGLVYTF